MAYFRRVISKQLGEILVERGVIDDKQLQEALVSQKDDGGLLGGILVRLGFVSEEDIAQALTTQFGFPYLPLETYEIEASMMKVVPEEMARKYWLVPIDKIGNTLTVAMADPLNTNAIKELERLTKCKVQAFVATITDVKMALDNCYAAKSG